MEAIRIKEKTVILNAIQSTTRHPQYFIFQPQGNIVQFGKISGALTTGSSLKIEK